MKLAEILFHNVSLGVQLVDLATTGRLMLLSNRLRVP
jgi:hypothetical protein